jgi:hypothetical protein
VQKVLDVILEVEAERNKRIPTSLGNDTLEELVARLQPPQVAGNEVRLIYATQVETAPPMVAVFGNHPDLVAEHYVRYLHNGFRAKYGFIGNPLRIVMRSKSAPPTDHRRVRAGPTPRSSVRVSSSRTRRDRSRPPTSPAARSGSIFASTAPALSARRTRGACSAGRSASPSM